TANLFPGMSDAEPRQLGEDIRARGLRAPVVFVGDGKTLIDGRNRLNAMERAGVPILDACAECGGPFDAVDQVDSVVYVVSADLHRRHLAAEQSENLIRSLRADRPQLSVRGSAAATHTSKSTVAG